MSRLGDKVIPAPTDQRAFDPETFWPALDSLGEADFPEVGDAICDPIPTLASSSTDPPRGRIVFRAPGLLVTNQAAVSRACAAALTPASQTRRARKSR